MRVAEHGPLVLAQPRARFAGEIKWHPYIAEIVVEPVCANPVQGRQSFGCGKQRIADLGKEVAAICGWSYMAMDRDSRPIRKLACSNGPLESPPMIFIPGGSMAATSLKSW